MFLLSVLTESLILSSIVYSILGIALLVISFIIVEKLTPKHNLWKEVVEENNMAIAIIAGFFMLAVSIIIASAIH